MPNFKSNEIYVIVISILSVYYRFRWLNGFFPDGSEIYISVEDFRPINWSHIYATYFFILVECGSSIFSWLNTPLLEMRTVPNYFKINQNSIFFIKKKKKPGIYINWNFHYFFQTLKILFVLFSLIFFIITFLNISGLYGYPIIAYIVRSLCIEKKTSHTTNAENFIKVWESR